MPAPTREPHGDSDVDDSHDSPDDPVPRLTPRVAYVPIDEDEDPHDPEKPPKIPGKPPVDLVTRGFPVFSLHPVTLTSAEREIREALADRRRELEAVA